MVPSVVVIDSREGTADMATNAQTGEIRDEYTTYPPSGSRCSDCGREFAFLVPARRAEQERGTGSPLVQYRHFECPEVKAR